MIEPGAAPSFPDGPIMADDLLDSLEELELEIDADDAGEPYVLDAQGRRLQTWREGYSHDERMTRQGMTALSGCYRSSY